jgi:hypothetical protein
MDSRLRGNDSEVSASTGSFPRRRESGKKSKEIIDTFLVARICSPWISFG